MVLARVLVADPPWLFGDSLPGKKRGAAKNYKCITTSEIMRAPLPPIAENAVLFLWRVSSVVEDAYQVVRAWGFVPKSEIVWNKTTESGEKDAIGMGRIVRGAHETCIVAQRGKLIEPRSKSERTTFRAPRTEHSAKPDEFYRIIERLYPLELWPEAHVDLYARQRRKGWVSYGDELPPHAANEPTGPMCILHEGEPVTGCRPCAITAMGVRLQLLLESTNGWRGMGWQTVRRAVDQDETEHLVSQNGDSVP